MAEQGERGVMRREPLTPAVIVNMCQTSASKTHLILSLSRGFNSSAFSFTRESESLVNLKQTSHMLSLKNLCNQKLVVSRHDQKSRLQTTLTGTRKTQLWIQVKLCKGLLRQQNV